MAESGAAVDDPEPPGATSMVMLADCRQLDLRRSRWAGPLDAPELAYCRAAGIEVGYDPVQIGWTIIGDGVDDAIDLAGMSPGGATTGGFAGSADDLPAADRDHWLEVLRWATDPGAAARSDRAAHDPGVRFRRWTPDDVAIHRALLDDARVWQHLPDEYPVPYTDATSRSLIELANDLDDHDVVAVEVDGTVVGQCLLRMVAGTGSPAVGEVAYWLGHAHWGRGLMRRVLPRFVDRCFLRPDLDLVVAWIHPDNVASIRTAERVGFRRDRFSREGALAAATGRSGFGRWWLARPR